MKTNQLGVLYFADTVSLGALLLESGSIEGQAFLVAWKSLPPETQQRLPSTIFNVESAKIRLQAANLFVLAHRPASGDESIRTRSHAIIVHYHFKIYFRYAWNVLQTTCQSSPLRCLAHTQVPGTTQEALYLTGRAGGVDVQILLEIRLVPGVPGLDVSFKCERADLAAMTFEALAQILA